MNVQPCRCGLKKHWEGDACEMNKFDEMILYLSHEVPTFTHIIAVDVNCVLFTRVWCVAELVQGHKCKLLQKVKLHSAKKLQKQLQQLEILDVRDARASREADKELVLSKIEDFDAFNQYVRDLVTDRKKGLLAAWWFAYDPGNELRSAADATSFLAWDFLAYSP